MSNGLIYFSVVSVVAFVLFYVIVDGEHKALVRRTACELRSGTLIELRSGTICLRADAVITVPGDF